MGREVFELHESHAKTMTNGLLRLVCSVRWRMRTTCLFTTNESARHRFGHYLKRLSMTRSWMDFCSCVTQGQLVGVWVQRKRCAHAVYSPTRTVPRSGTRSSTRPALQSSSYQRNCRDCDTCCECTGRVGCLQVKTYSPRVVLITTSALLKRTLFPRLVFGVCGNFLRLAKETL